MRFVLGARQLVIYFVQKLRNACRPGMVVEGDTGNARLDKEILMQL